MLKQCCSLPAPMAHVDLRAQSEVGVQKERLRGQIRWEAPPLGHVWGQVLFVLNETREDSQRAQTLTGQVVFGGGWCPAGQAFSLKHYLIQVQPN